MTEEQLCSHIAYRLCKDPSPIPVKELIDAFFPYDIQAGHLLMQAVQKHALRGTLTTNLVRFEGKITGMGPNW